MAPDPDDVEVSSPVCYASEADDAYMGFATGDEIVAELNHALEFGRAIGRASFQSALQVESAPLPGMPFRKMSRSEAKLCGALQILIAALGGRPSEASDDLYERVLSIEDVEERARQLRNARQTVVNRLRTLLPKLRSDQLHRRINALLEDYDRTITSDASDKNG